MLVTFCCPLASIVGLIDWSGSPQSENGWSWEGVILPIYRLPPTFVHTYALAFFCPVCVVSFFFVLGLGGGWQALDGHNMLAVDFLLVVVNQTHETTKKGEKGRWTMMVAVAHWAAIHVSSIMNEWWLSLWSICVCAVLFFSRWGVVVDKQVLEPFFCFVFFVRTQSVSRSRCNGNMNECNIKKKVPTSSSARATQIDTGNINDCSEIPLFCCM